MESAGHRTRPRTVFSCVRRIGDGVIGYELVLPAAVLLGAEPLVAHDTDEPAPSDRFPTRGLRVVVNQPLVFDPIDEARGFGLVTIPRGTRLGFDGCPEVRHGMVRVALVAALPETVWRLPATLTPVAA